MVELRLTDLSVGYREGKQSRVIAGPLNLEAAPGSLVCLLGVNGAGKSTLMRTIAGLQAPLVGRVTVDGQDLHRLRPADRARRLGVVLTERPSAGMLDVYSLVSLGRHPYSGWSGRLSAEDHRIIAESLRAVEAEQFVGRLVMELSDGERQRVMMARALAQQTAILLLDELTAFLDLSHRIEMMALMKQLAQERGKTIISSTHDLDLALRSADRVWLIAPRDGGQPANAVDGIPEEVVLSGAFAKAFESSNVHFDLSSANFRLRAQPHQEVTLTCDELCRTDAEFEWTRRLLERLGYATCTRPNGAACSVHVSRKEAGLSWQVRFGEVERHVGDLRELSQVLTGARTDEPRSIAQPDAQA